VTVEDTTAPTIAFVSRLPAANTFGWNNTNVTVNWSCSDTVGVLSSTVSQTVSTEGSALSATGTCEDTSGNVASDTQSGIKIDKTAPTLAPAVSPNPVTLNGSATVAANASDALSGLDAVSCGSVDASSVGSKTVSCSAADKAGNSASASANYNVQYASSGMCYGGLGHAVLQPINTDGSSSFKQGSTVPVKFRVCDAYGNSIGVNPVANPNAPILYQVNSGALSVNETAVSTTPDTAFRWDASSQQWIFNLNTRNLTSNKTYYYRIDLADGTSILFRFSLR
jgi:hypothetical protein